MKKFLLGTAAALLAVGSAAAADLPARVYTKAPILEPAYNWSGFYIGATAGGALHNTTSQDDGEYYQYANATNSAAAAVIGGTIGYNWQFGNGVIGIEGDGNWSSYKKTSYNSYEDSYYSSQWDWFATIRARAGLAVGNALIYATAGVAFVESKNNLWYPGSGYYCGYYQTCFGASTNTGFTAGVGAEYMVSGNWSVKAEYLYINLPSKSFTDMTGPNNISFKDDAHIARLGINYHFR